jgi:hypothetical protein
MTGDLCPPPRECSAFSRVISSVKSITKSIAMHQAQQLHCIMQPILYHTPSKFVQSFTTHDPQLLPKSFKPLVHLNDIAKNRANGRQIRRDQRRRRKIERC